jgi:phosphotransacetylase
MFKEKFKEIPKREGGREMEKPRTKEEAQQELQEKFGMRKTSDFQAALAKGEIEKAKAWLQYIIDHKDQFPQYQATWDSWLADRQSEILFYEQKSQVTSGQQKLEELPVSKERAQLDLELKFGMRKTSDFQAALQKGEIEKAEKWLQYIIDHKDQFPQYQATWESWLSDRKAELSTFKALWEKRKSGARWEKITPRTKEVAQTELFEKFGMRKTSDFQAALTKGEIEKAKAWLQYIVDNKDQFPQYQTTWDSWLADRKREIREAEEREKKSRSKR